MSEEVVRTIENVDRLFSEIIVNGESHVSQRYTSPSVQSASPSSVQSTQGEDVHAVELNDTLHNFSDPDVVLDVQTLQQGLAGEVSARTTADQALDSAIAQETNARSSADNTLQGNINAVSGNVSTLQGKVATIEGEIPSQASAQNQLADKNFVNSSISTNTANFLGTYTSMADIEAIPNPTNNDYVFLQTTDSVGNNVFDRYKYNAEQEEWLFEYELNNSSFTAEQWATINSGLTSSSISDAINALDVAQAGGAGKYIESISQVNGKIVVTEKTFAVALLDIAHPVGSLYWTSSSENPAVTFGGGTWTQIKDVFVWAKGDSDTVNATGGAKTVTLTTQQIPSHTHTFTGSEVTSSANNRGHTHSVTASGTISGGAYKFTGTQATLKATQGGTISGGAYKFTGTEVTSGAMSGNSTGSAYPVFCPNESQTFKATGNMGFSNLNWGAWRKSGTGDTLGWAGTISTNVAHTHKVTASGTVSVTTNPTFTGSEHSHTFTPTGTVSVTTNPSFTGSAVTSGAESQNHTHKVTASGTNSNTGGGEAHNNMPPYVVKYCWERTA